MPSHPLTLIVETQAKSFLNHIGFLNAVQNSQGRIHASHLRHCKQEKEDKRVLINVSET